MVRILDLIAICFLIFLPFLFKNVKGNRFQVVFYIIVVCFVISLRTVGDDTSEYIDIFHSIDSSLYFPNGNRILGFKIEPTWFFIVSIIKNIVGPIHVVFFFFSILVPVLIILHVASKVIVYDFNKCIFLSVYLLTVYFFAINGLRSFFAASFIPLIIYHYANDRFVSAILFWFTSIHFHFSMIIVLPIIFILRFNIRTLILMLLFLLCSFSYFLYSDSLDLIQYSYHKLVYYLYDIEHDFLSANHDRKEYVFWARAYFIVTWLFNFVIFLFLMSGKVSENIAERSMLKFFAVILIVSSFLMLAQSFILSMRVLYFSQPVLAILVFCKLKCVNFRWFSFLFISYSTYWLVFVVYASRFYDV